MATFCSPFASSVSGVTRGVEASKSGESDKGFEERRRRRVKEWVWIRKSATVRLPEQMGPAIPMNMTCGGREGVILEVRDADF